MTRKLDFKISSGLKNIIGKELITDDHIAVFEMVKNSFDANAHNVKIIFEKIKNPTKNDSKIFIIDDGVGMSFKKLEGEWLFVGYSEKSKSGKTEKTYRDKLKAGKRIFAGYKGIGRFSADRLGAKLSLFTKEKNKKPIHRLDVDWKKFEVNQKEKFDNIHVIYSKKNELPEEIPIENFKQGTILEISSLNSSWDHAKLLKLKRHLQRLVNPAPLNYTSDFQIELQADEFVDEDSKKIKKNRPYEVTNGIIKNIVFEKLGIKTVRIDCEITKTSITTVVTDKDKFVFKLKEKNTFDSLEDIKIHIFYLNRKAKETFTKIMGIMPKDFGSIFLYKNGFRIQPYGEVGDDWLELLNRKLQGLQRYFSTREMMGRVEVYGPQLGFNEVSSRSGGVIKGKSIVQLKTLVLEKVVKRLEKYVVEGIDWDPPEHKVRKTPQEINADSIELIEQIVGQVEDPHKKIEFNPELLSIFKERQIEKIPELIKNLEVIAEFVTSKTDKEYIKRQIIGLRQSSQRLVTRASIAEKRLEVKTKENLFLQKSLSMDDVIAQNLNHTIGIASDTIKGLIEEIMQSIDKDVNIESIKILLEKISLQNQRVISLTGLVTNAAFDLMHEHITEDIVAYISQYVQRVLVEIDDGMMYSIQNADIVYETTFSPLEIAVMIDNFLSNSQKAEATKMNIKFKTKNNFLHILIGDDGEGIKKDDEEFIFTRGHTTTKGSGIGMNHIQTIAESMGGQISFLGNNVNGFGKGACFEVILHEFRE